MYTLADMFRVSMVGMGLYILVWTVSCPNIDTYPHPARSRIRRILVALTMIGISLASVKLSEPYQHDAAIWAVLFSISFIVFYMIWKTDWEKRTNPPRPTQR
jgi:hypothetical protein